MLCSRLDSTWLAFTWIPSWFVTTFIWSSEIRDNTHHTTRLSLRLWLGWDAHLIGSLILQLILRTSSFLLRCWWLSRWAYLLTGLGNRLVIYLQLLLLLLLLLVLISRIILLVGNLHHHLPHLGVAKSYCWPCLVCSLLALLVRLLCLWRISCESSE